MQRSWFALTLALAVPVWAGEPVPAPQSVTRLELDPARAGEIVTMMGEVTAIEAGPGGLQFYAVKPDQAPQLTLWVTTFVRVAPGQVKVGDQLAFKGYIAKAAALDPTGRLHAQLEANTLLQARSIETSLGQVQRDVPLPLTLANP